MPDQLPVFRIIAEPMSGNVPDPKDPKSLGRRSKFGGQPTWEQEDETPTCPQCGKSMAFIAQLDSIGFDQRDTAAEPYVFGNVGLIYVFFCFEDGETHSVFQCT
jgi:hypothetical protein